MNDSCNWLGGHATVLAMDWFGNETLHNTPFTNMTIDGVPVAAVQNVENFSFACVQEFSYLFPSVLIRIPLPLNLLKPYGRLSII